MILNVAFAKCCKLASFLVMASSGLVVLAQPAVVSTRRAHSHNDYLQSQPFHLAYQHHFGSLEADIYFLEDSLFVAHEKGEITPERTFDHLYLNPITSLCKAQNGRIYPEENRTLQLLIDLKTAYAPTLGKLVEKLAPYQALWYPKGTVKIVISGNTPPPSEFSHYPAYIFFDGRPEISYTKEQTLRLGLISQSFTRYSQWNGKDKLPEADRNELDRIIMAAHSLGKPFRFWATPDNPVAWETLIGLKADYINTDKIEELAAYLSQKSR